MSLNACLFLSVLSELNSNVLIGPDTNWVIVHNDFDMFFAPKCDHELLLDIDFIHDDVDQFGFAANSDELAMG